MLSTAKFLRGRRLLLAAAVVLAGWVVLPASAQAAICGNGPPGFPEPGEQCDDGNLVGGDLCSAFCTEERCGNATLDVGEACDPATGSWSFPTPNYANASTATCTWKCLLSICGDVLVNGAAGETCDLGAANTSTCDGASAGANKCTARNCGDGYSNSTGNEACDDGNLVNNDTCDSNCKPPGCGNGVAVGPAEQCDDGNLTNNDGCDSNCFFTNCGNGVTAGTEQCDDYATYGYPPVSGDGCSATCQLEVCGNGTVDAPVENCDPPTPNICNASCRYLSCGNGVIESPEACDPGTPPGTAVATGNPLIASSDSAGCDINCSVNQCGDGYTNGYTEYCDPGSVGGNNTIPVVGVACDAACRFTVCGNGIVNSQEQCDTNCGNSGDPFVSNCSSANCDINCTNKVCGDNYTNIVGGEECDPPVAALACSTACKNMVCGDSIVQAPEACDTGCGNSGNPFMSNCASPGCSINCTSPVCGNAALDPGEACEDGNLVSGDGCDSNCTVTACGNGIKTAGENCDGTVGCTDLDVLPYCTDTVCGNGVVSTMPGLEQCDDGPGAAAAVQADGCTIACKSDPDRDGLLNPIDECNAIQYAIPAGSGPLGVLDQNPAKATLRLSGLNLTGKNGITFRGEFNPDRKRVCSGDPLNLTTCAVDADCAGVGGTCGPPNPNKTGVTIRLKNGSSVLYTLNVAGDNQAPGGEYIRNSPTPACGNRLDGWAKKTSTSGKVTFIYANRSGLMPIPADLVPYGVDGSCSGSAKGLRSLTLVYDSAKAKWTYNATVSKTTLDLPPTVAGSPAKVQGTLQLEVSLGFGSLNAPGSVGQCFDNQYRGSLPGGTGPVTACTVKMVGVVPSSVSCK